VGNLYGSVTLLGVRPDRVAAELELARQEAYVYAEGGDVVVFPPLGDELELPALAGLLAGRLRAPALAVTVIDSDALVLHAYDAFGELRDQYDNAPGYFGDAEVDDLPLGSDGMPLPTGGDAALLVALAARGDEAAVEAVLRREWESYTFAEELHQALLEQLGLPLAAVGTDYALVADGQRPAGDGDWRHVSAG
jgi:hypothetical protein